MPAGLLGWALPPSVRVRPGLGLAAFSFSSVLNSNRTSSRSSHFALKTEFTSRNNQGQQRVPAAIICRVFLSVFKHITSARLYDYHLTDIESCLSLYRSAGFKVYNRATFDRPFCSFLLKFGRRPSCGSCLACYLGLYDKRGLLQGSFWGNNLSYLSISIVSTLLTMVLLSLSREMRRLSMSVVDWNYGC